MIQKVLVVDDDDALREMVGLVLAGAGYEPVFAADGIEAVEIFKSHEPDLVLLDIMLPGQSGIEVCRQIRAVSGVPIVMLTAKGDTEDVVLGLEAGADDYVVKPHKGAELLARVKARLRPLPDDDVILQVGGLSLVLVSPNLLQQHFSAENLLRLGRQRVKQLEFQRSQRQTDSVSLNLKGLRVKA